MTLAICILAASFALNLVLLCTVIHSLNRIFGLTKELIKQDIIVEDLQKAIDKVFTRELKQMLAEDEFRRTSG